MARTLRRGSNIRSVVAAVVVLAATAAAHANTVQIDQISMSGPTYRGDLWSLTVAGPVFSTVTYTVTPDDELGSNIVNAATNWAAAINADSVLGAFLIASFISGPPATPAALINLVGKIANTSFHSSVSALEASQDDGNESEPLAVSVRTIAPVPLPAPLPLLAASIVGLVAFGAARRRARTAR